MVITNNEVRVQCIMQRASFCYLYFVWIGITKCKGYEASHVCLSEGWNGTDDGFVWLCIVCRSISNGIMHSIARNKISLMELLIILFCVNKYVRVLYVWLIGIYNFWKR